LAQFLASIFEGRSEDSALAALSVSSRDFLDAAAETETDRAVRTISEDPILPALRTARAALVLNEIDRADAALATVVGPIADTASDAGLAADARLCLAQMALARGETKNAATLLAAASAGSRIVRV